MARDTRDIHMRNVVGLKTRPQRFREDQANTLKAVLLPFLDHPDYDQEPIHRLLHEIDRKTRPDAPAETFVMIQARPERRRRGLAGGQQPSSHEGHAALGADV